MYKNSNTLSNNTALWHYFGAKHLDFRHEIIVPREYYSRKYGSSVLNKNSTGFGLVLAYKKGSSLVLELIS